jgi:7-carboxy-7-deazaguanine synthase
MRVSEVYLSVQGEGPRVGIPTVFVRFGGCNLKCAKWPCDTPHAIDAKNYRQEWIETGQTVLTERITQFCTNNICFTGGEPMLQLRTGMQGLIATLDNSGYHMEMFSNGTLLYPRSVYWHVDIVMDWKLPGSGEATDVEERWANAFNLNRMNKDYGRHNAIKFTITGRDDFEVALEVYDQLRAKKLTHIPIYYGVVWGKLADAKLIEWVLQENLPWRHNMQVHNYVWDRTQRGI